MVYRNVIIITLNKPTPMYLTAILFKSISRLQTMVILIAVA